MELAVENHTDHNFESVEVGLHIPGRLEAFFDDDEARGDVHFPQRPIPWGTPRNPLGSLGFDIPRVSPYVRPRPSRGRIENRSSAKITFAPTTSARGIAMASRGST